MATNTLTVVAPHSTVAANTDEAMAPAPAPVRRYQDLPGQSGPTVWFRPDRYDAKDFEDIRVELSLVRPDGVSIEGTLHDISFNGLAFDASPRCGLVVGDKIASACLAIEDHVVYQGALTIRSIRTDGDRTVYGGILTDSLLNIDEVLRLRTIVTECRRAHGHIATFAQTFRQDDAARFKAMVGDFRLFLLAAQSEIGHLERSLDWEDVSHPGSAGRATLFRMLDEGFVSEWKRWLVRINDEYVGQGLIKDRALKAFATEHLKELIIEAPFMYRAFCKPLGYPGDFMLMNYIYSPGFEGPNLYARCVHRAAATTPGGEAVRSRKRYFMDRLLEHVAEKHADKKVARVAAIASGPAQELVDFVQAYPQDQGRTEVVLFDQDKRALSQASSTVTRTLREQRREDITITCVHDSIKTLFKGEGVLSQLEPFDLIYAAGLFDYLPRELAQVLCGRLYQFLRPGGHLYIGNFSDYNPTRWGMEHLGDWYLIHRTPAELMEVAEPVGPTACPEVVAEPTGVNLILGMTKVT